MLKLFMSPGSSSMAVHIALYEVGAPFEIAPISFEKRENRSPDYLRINAEGKVPTLLIDEHPLTEVAGILFYLAMLFPESHLALPAAPEKQARIVSWMSFLASSVHPARRKGLGHALAMYEIVEKRFGDHAFVLGDDYSIADIHLFRLLWRFRNSLNPAFDKLPRLNAFYERMMRRPAVSKVLDIESALGYELPL